VAHPSRLTPIGHIEDRCRQQLCHCTQSGFIIIIAILIDTGTSMFITRRRSKLRVLLSPSSPGCVRRACEQRRIAMRRMKTTIRAWGSPSRYVQGPDVFQDIVKYINKFGKAAIAVIDQFFFGSLSAQIDTLCESTGTRVKSLIFDSEVTVGLIERYTAEARAYAPAVVVGIGGGKTIDVAKAVAAKIERPTIIVPTAASTDAPTSALSVLYDEDGSYVTETFHDSNPSILLVDSRIIANAPVRFLVAGMGDALSTLFEARANRISDSPNLIYPLDGGFRSTILGRGVAEKCYETLLKRGLAAKTAAEKHVVVEALEDIIETNILLSGLGFENNGTAAAHAICDGLSALRQAARALHGERVAFGVICQLVLENAAADVLQEVLSFCSAVGLPTTLGDLNVENTMDNIRVIADAAMHSAIDREPFEVTSDMVFNAIVVADSLGDGFRRQGKLTVP
jgi:glycerol dehydrogenase